MKRHLKAKLSIGKPLSARRTSESTASDKQFAGDNIDATANAGPNDRNVPVSQLGRVDVWVVNSKGELVRCNEGTTADGSTKADVSLCVVDSLQKYALKRSLPAKKVEAAFEAIMRAMPVKSLRLGKPLFTPESLQEDLSEWLLEAYEVDPNTRLNSQAIAQHRRERQLGQSPRRFLASGDRAHPRRKRQALERGQGPNASE